MSKAKSLPQREEASEVAVEWVDERNTRLGGAGGSGDFSWMREDRIATGYEVARALLERGVSITIRWTPHSREPRGNEAAGQWTETVAEDVKESPSSVRQVWPPSPEAPSRSGPETR